MGTTATLLNDIIEKTEDLSFEEQEILLDLLTHRHIEKRREQIAANAKSTIREYKSGLAKTGTANDLKKYLEND